MRQAGEQQRPLLASCVLKCCVVGCGDTPAFMWVRVTLFRDLRGLPSLFASQNLAIAPSRGGCLLPLWGDSFYTTVAAALAIRCVSVRRFCIYRMYTALLVGAAATAVYIRTGSVALTSLRWQRTVVRPEVSALARFWIERLLRQAAQNLGQSREGWLGQDVLQFRAGRSRWLPEPCGFSPLLPQGGRHGVFQGHVASRRRLHLLIRVGMCL